MHYKDGTPVEVGDICKGMDNSPIAGIVVHLMPGSDICNMVVQITKEAIELGYYPENMLVVMEDGIRRFLRTTMTTVTAGEFELLWRKPRETTTPAT